MIPAVCNQMLGDHERDSECVCWELESKVAMFAVCDLCLEMEFGAAMFVGSRATWELESLTNSGVYLTARLLVRFYLQAKCGLVAFHLMWLSF